MAYYVQLDADYWDHPKTLHLVGLMGQRGETIPLKMWSWATRFKVSGKFDSVEQLALACRYKGNPEVVQKALKDAGFIDADGLTIHDWHLRTGHGIAMYEREKERQRLKAERYRSERDAKSTDGTSHGSTPVRTTITGPDRTGPDLTGPKSPPPPLSGGDPSPTPRSRKKSRRLTLNELERKLQEPAHG